MKAGGGIKRPRVASASTSASTSASISASNRNAALADATSGAIASLIALWVFYPVDVYKTSLQAGRSILPSSSTRTSSSASATVGTILSRKKLLFAGWKTKTLHTLSSSFCYFYLYSWIVSRWMATADRTKRVSLSAPSRLALSAVAAMLNTCLTLPLDVLSARQQISQTHHGNNATADDDDKNMCVRSLDGFAENEEEKKEACYAQGRGDFNHAHTQTSSLQLSSLRQIRSLWKGLNPSLLLCSNPAIHYTIFDSLKSRILEPNKINSNNHDRDPNQTRNRSLTMPQAFLLGIIAKFVATIATYPLIRAKVMLMVTSPTLLSSSSSSSPVASDHGDDLANDSSRNRKSTSTRSNNSLWECLTSEYKDHGMRGLYRGCDWQLLHTLLKSALLMMMRERIARITHRVICGHSSK